MAARSAASKASSTGSRSAASGAGGGVAAFAATASGAPVLDEVGDEVGPSGLGDEGVGEAGEEGVARSHAVAGEAEVFAEAAGGVGEELRAADVGDEADRAFGHRDLGSRADDAVAGVAGDADAAAHDEAAHQRHDRLRVAGDPRVHPVFVGPERAGRGEVAAASGAVDFGDVAAGAEGALALGIDQDEGHVRVGGPGVEGGRDRQRHRVGERVQRLRAGQGDAAGAALGADADVGHVCSARSARATMTRMISLVPSRIWWTRRSRTIFSTP